MMLENRATIFCFGSRCSLIVILNKRSLRSEKPRRDRAMCRVLCDTITARLARFPIKLHHHRFGLGWPLRFTTV
jgi:hypothetical protein